jgi:nicotinic acetylcholine receptor
MSILLLMVSDQMPTTSDLIPLIGWFFLSIIILISTGTFMSSVVICVHARGQLGRRVPAPLRKIFFSCLPVLLRTRPPLGMLLDREIEAQGLSLDEAVDGDEAPLVTIFNRLRQNGLRRRGSRRGSPDRSRSPRASLYGAAQGEFGMRPPSPGAYKTLSPTEAGPGLGGRGGGVPGLGEAASRQLDEIERSLGEMRSFVVERQVGSQAVLEWEYLATVLDRILLLFFVSAVVTVTLGMIVVGLFINQNV